MPTATTTRVSDQSAQVAGAAADSGRQVASTAADSGRRVAGTAAGRGRQVAGRAAEQAKDLGSTATERGGDLVRVAKDDARQLAGTVKERAGEVTEQLSTQGRSLLEEARAQVDTQARTGSQRLAGAFQQMGEQAMAIAEGRPEDAPTLTEYAFKAADGCYGAADRLSSLSDEIDTRGIGAMLDDLQGFARRKPGTFLLGAALVGFGVGRLVKAQSADEDEDDETPVGRQRALPAAQNRQSRSGAVR